MRPALPPLCVFCEHYNPDGVCKAFPDGIPGEILYNHHPHFEPYRNETVTFKKRPDVPQEEVQAWVETYNDLTAADMNDYLDRSGVPPA